MWYVITFMAGAAFGVAVMCACIVSGSESRKEEAENYKETENQI